MAESLPFIFNAKWIFYDSRAALWSIYFHDGHLANILFNRFCLSEWLQRSDKSAKCRKMTCLLFVCLYPLAFTMYIQYRQTSKGHFSIKFETFQG